MVNAKTSRPGWAILAPLAHVLVSLIIVVALVAFPGGRPLARPRWWLAALPLGVALVAAGEALDWTGGSESGRLLLDGVGWWALGIVVAAVVHLVGVARGRWDAPAWTMALALTALTVMVARLLILSSYLTYHDFGLPGFATACLLEALALTLAVGVLMVRLARRAPSGRTRS